MARAAGSNTQHLATGAAIWAQSWSACSWGHADQRTITPGLRLTARAGHTPRVEFLDQAAPSRPGFSNVEVRVLTEAAVGLSVLHLKCGRPTSGPSASEGRGSLIQSRQVGDK